jgi:tRNA (guanine-N1)-methyltransferase
MRFDIITLMPELLESPFNHSILKRAKEKGLLHVHLHQLRDYAINKHGQVDDMQYGGGAGMVMMMEPIVNCLEALQSEKKFDEVIYMYSLNCYPEYSRYKSHHLMKKEDQFPLIFQLLIQDNTTCRFYSLKFRLT